MTLSARKQGLPPIRAHHAHLSSNLFFRRKKSKVGRLSFVLHIDSTNEEILYVKVVREELTQTFAEILWRYLMFLNVYSLILAFLQ
jgi:hypothetical protein